MKTLHDPVAPGDRLPDLSFEDASGRATPLRASGRQGAVVVLVHGSECDACGRYLAALAAADAQHREWDGRVVAVVPGAAAGTDALNAAPLPFPVLADPEGRAWAALGIEGSAVVIADQWGEVHEVARGGAGHDLPDADAITEWLRYLAIRCPECEGEAL